MNNVIIFQMLLLAVVVVGWILGSIGLERVGQIFLAVGIIDLIMSFLAWRGWRILRGDISTNAPINKYDSREPAQDEYSIDHDRPSTGFVVKVAIIGMIALGIGVILLIFSS